MPEAGNMPSNRQRWFELADTKAELEAYKPTATTSNSETAPVTAEPQPTPKLFHNPAKTPAGST